MHLFQKFTSTMPHKQISRGLLRICNLQKLSRLHFSQATRHLSKNTKMHASRPKARFGARRTLTMILPFPSPTFANFIKPQLQTLLNLKSFLEYTWWERNEYCMFYLCFHVQISFKSFEIFRKANEIAFVQNPMDLFFFFALFQMQIKATKM